MTTKALDLAQLGSGLTVTSNAATYDGTLDADNIVVDDKIVHSGDTDTAIRFPAADTVTVETSGAERMRIDSSGNVGINGAATSGIKLAINDANPRLRLNHSTATANYGELSFGLSGVANAAAIRSYRVSENFVGNEGDLRFYTFAGDVGGSDAPERMRLDAVGNLGLGVTPSAWGVRALEIAGPAFIGSSSPAITLSTNGVFSGSAWSYKTTAAASAYGQNTGAHYWYTAPSGTAGNAITFTQAMTLNASGQLILGGPTPSGSAKLTVNGAATETTLIGTNGSIEAFFNGGAGTTVSLMGTTGNFPLGFYTNGSERARIDASGNLLVGTTGSITGGNIQTYTASGGANVDVYAAGAGAIAKFRMYNDTDQAAIGCSGNNLIFYNSSVNTERARIDASGNLLVGTTSADPITAATNGISLGSDQIIRVSKNSTSTAAFDRRGTDGTVVTFHKAATQVGRIDVTTTATSYVTSSDYRLKEDILPMSGASERLLALKPVNFAWRVNGSRVDGFIAHEVQAIVPEAVTGIKDAVDEDGNPEYQGIDQSKLVPLLTAALQEAMAKIEALEARITALEA